jgi:hypothetical protein
MRAALVPFWGAGLAFIARLLPDCSRSLNQRRIPGSTFDQGAKNIGYRAFRIVEVVELDGDIPQDAQQGSRLVIRQVKIVGGIVMRREDAQEGGAK